MSDSTWALLVPTVAATILAAITQILVYMKARDAARLGKENHAAISELGIRVDGRLTELLRSRGVEADLREVAAHAKGVLETKSGVADTANELLVKARADAEALLAEAREAAESLLAAARTQADELTKGPADGMYPYVSTPPRPFPGL